MTLHVAKEDATDGGHVVHYVRDDGKGGGRAVRDDRDGRAVAVGRRARQPAPPRVARALNVCIRTPDAFGRLLPPTTTSFHKTSLHQCRMSHIAQRSMHMH